MKRHRKTRSGLTLLEMIIASSLLTVMVTSVALLLRTGNTTWKAIDDDQALLRSGHATLSHIVRRVRQADSVTAISAAGDNSGSLSIGTASGQTYVWDHNSVTNQVFFGVGSATDLLAEGIAELNFVGYKADGTTATTTVADIHSVKCQVKVQLPRDSGGDRIIQCWAWIRSW